MMRAAIISVAMLAVPGTVQACAIMPQACEIAGGAEAHLNGSNGAVVFFRELAVGVERTVVVECTSRAALAVTAPTTSDFDDYWAAENIMEIAVFDDAPQTLSQVAREITQETGLSTQRFTLAAGHCGCDLPNMPRPQTICPQDS